MQLLVVPSSPSFLVYIKFVVPSLHSKSEPGQDIVSSEWWFAWPWNACSYWWIFCSMEQLWWVCLALKIFVNSYGGCRSATCTFLISRCSVGVLSAVADQLDGSCISHCGPFHHSVDVERVVGSTPLEISRIGLKWHMSPCCWSCFFLSGGNSVAYKCLSSVWWTLYPC